MKKSEVKKALYKQKPTAVLHGMKNGNFRYKTEVKSDDGYDYIVYFSIPPDEAEGFKDLEPAQLLIRWML